ncbi:MAG: hypothetical protein WEB02_10825 [Methylophaga sp.]
MALINCKECDKKVSDKAKTCPSCGVKIKKDGPGFWSYVAAISVLLIAWSVGFIDNDTVTTVDAEPCETDECIYEKYYVEMSVICKPKIEQQTEYDHEWTDGLLNPWARGILVNHTEPKIVTYGGSNLKFQNQYGAWRKMQYGCVYKFEEGELLNFWIEPLTQ